ncbi:hypothetical protein JZ751_004069 [Albula glossodonta]|uniref:RBR-type E3 ubiquitin transferase n=1 Tax=Albula glossodonta TaxID=121402 RepID=A0A8T2P712_9TELE|nr:hypothetical protein JZ751_004069 [Albula glossodonta]
MSDDLEAQDDELLAIASIYDREEFRRDGCARGGEIRICPDLPRDFKVTTKEGDTCTEYRLSFLPPLVLDFELPADYPSTSSPQFTLNCKWLSNVQFLREDILSFLQISPLLDLPSQWDSRINAEASEEGAVCGASATLSDEEQLDLRAAPPVDSDTDLLLHLLDFNEAQQRKVFEGRVFDCGICFSQKLGSDCLCFRDCQHVYCTACMSEYYTVQIREGTTRALKCPQSECNSEATPMQVKQLVGEELFDRYDRLLLQSSLDSMTDVVYCPRRTCGTAVMVEPDNTTAICSACGYAFCTLCKQSNHGLYNCRDKRARETEKGTDTPYASLPNKEEGLRDLWEDYETGSKARRKFLEQRYGRKALQSPLEDALSDSWISENTKECPKCSATIQKNGGCNKMVCYKCHCFFCWVCLIILPQLKPYQHFEDPKSPCSNFFLTP